MHSSCDAHDIARGALVVAVLILTARVISYNEHVYSPVLHCPAQQLALVKRQLHRVD